MKNKIKWEKGAPVKVIISIVLVLTMTLGVMGCAKGDSTSSDRPGVIGGVARSAEPEKYLRAAFEKTADNIETASDDYPDFSQFSGAPAEQSLSVNITSLINTPELAGTNAALIAKTNPAAEKLLLDLSVGYKGINLKNNQLFISGDLLALSMPDLYSRNKYITVNPLTFTDDWNNSPLGESNPIAPDQAAEYLRALQTFNNLASATGERHAAAENLVSEWRAQTDSAFQNASFNDEGTEELTIAGKTIKKAAKMSYSMSAEEAKAFYTSLVSALCAYLEDYAGYMSQVSEITGAAYNPYPQEGMDELFAELDKIDFTNGINFTCYVDEDTGFVNRVSLDNVTLAHSDYPGDDTAISAQIDMLGDENVLDDLAISVTAQSNAGQTTSIVMTNSTARGDIINNKLTLSAQSDGQRAVDLEYLISWEPAAEKDNLSLNIKIDADNSASDISLKGNMTASDDGISVTDGVLEVVSDDQTAASLSFDYAVRPISAEDVDIDRSQAADLFSLDLGQLQQDIMSAAMKLAMLG